MANAAEKRVVPPLPNPVPRISSSSVAEDLVVDEHVAFIVCSTSQAPPVDLQAWGPCSQDAESDSTQVVTIIPARPLPQPKPAAVQKPRFAGRSPYHLLCPQPVQLAVSMLLVVALAVLIYKVSSTTELRPETEAAATPVRPLDLNLAGRDELRLLPGVGDKLSQRIDDYRRQHGGFRRVEDLRQVHGIGAKTLDRLRPLVYVSDEDSEQPPAEESEPVVASRTAKFAPSAVAAKAKPAGDAPRKLIDLNRADAAELRNLPGIGPKLSQRIVDVRNARGPFRSIDDLRHVPGIGPKTLERVKPFLTLEREPEPISIQR